MLTHGPVRDTVSLHPPDKVLLPVDEDNLPQQETGVDPVRVLDRDDQPPPGDGEPVFRGELIPVHNSPLPKNRPSHPEL